MDYAPTQNLAEAFRQRRYDGIFYNSELNKDGKNVALFSLSHADVKERSLYTLSDVFVVSSTSMTLVKKPKKCKRSRNSSFIS